MDERACHQWIGPNHRLTLWRSHPGAPVLLGHIQEDGDGWWSAWMAGEEDDPLERGVSRVEAADVLGAVLGIARPQLPGLTEEDGDDL